MAKLKEYEQAFKSTPQMRRHKFWMQFFSIGSSLFFVTSIAVLIFQTSTSNNAQNLSYFWGVSLLLSISMGMKARRRKRKLILAAEDFLEEQEKENQLKEVTA